MFRTTVIYVPTASLYEQAYVSIIEFHGAESLLWWHESFGSYRSSLSEAYGTRRFFTTFNRAHRWTSSWASEIQPTLSLLIQSQYNPARIFRTYFWKIRPFNCEDNRLLRGTRWRSWLTHCKPEGHGFDYWWMLSEFFIGLILLAALWPWGVKAAAA